MIELTIETWPLTVEALPSSVNFKTSVLCAVERLNSIHPPSYLSPAVEVPPAMVMSVSSAPNPAFSV